MAEPGSAATPFPAEALEQSWGHRFRTIAKLYPHRIALADRTHSITYAELESASNRIASAIRQVAKRPHRTIAVALPDPLDAVTAMLGVIASGHLFLPVDPAWPDHHLQAVLTRMHADLLIVRGTQPPPGTAIPCIGFDEANARSDDGALTSPAPGDPVCLYATSGSTGEAKGIVLPHRCLMHAARNYINRMEVTPGDRIAWTNPITAGAALLPIMSALLSGASLHRFDLRAEGFTRFNAWMENERITIWSAVPSLFRSFADHLPPGPNLPALRLIKLGGEPVYASDVALFEQRLAPSCRLMNGLGITECGGNVCWHNHTRGKNVTTPTLPVGQALPSMKLSIRYDDAPDASPGELVVHSAYLALGYWNSATGAIDPFPVDPDTQLAEFRTGDLVTQDTHGALIHLGRNDGMLKVRGHRIERTRIEAALLTLPWIREASVGVQSSTGVDQLIAHIVWRDHSTPEIEEMRKALLRILPVHEIPSRFIPVAALPRLSGGKIDRMALRNMMDEEPAACDGPAPDLLERQLLVVWEKALGRKPRSVEEDFFAAGGDSLAAVRLFAQLDQRLGINLPIATLSHHRTVRALAAHVNALGKAAARSCAHLLQAGDHRTPLFAIPGAGSDSLALLELAQSLDPRQTVYAMQYAGLAEGEVFQNRIPEIAAHFLREVRRIQPSGPYALAGTSFGGWVAFEMARQLIAAGERVATLALLDTFGPGYLDPLPDPTLRRRALHALRWWFPLGNKEELSFANLRAGIREKMERLAARVLRLVRPDRVLPRKLRYLHLQDQCFAAGKAYRPTPYHGGIIHLFRAEKQPPASLFHITPDMGWTPLAAAGLRIHDVPGHHGAHIRLPHVQELARQLQACLPGLTTTEPGRFSELADQSRARWEELAAWWDAQSADEGHADTRNVLLPLCLHLLQPKKDEHVIDAACGNGWIARRLARLGARVTAFDYSAALLERARQRDQVDRVEYLHLDATRADELARLGRHTADSALCYMALMDIADLVPLLTALSRAVRPGGRFVFTMIHPDSAALARVNEAQVLTSMGKNDQPVEHYYFHRPMSLLLDTFEQCGWEIDQLSSPGTPDGAQFLVGRLINSGA